MKDADDDLEFFYFLKVKLHCLILYTKECQLDLKCCVLL